MNLSCLIIVLAVIQQYVCSAAKDQIVMGNSDGTLEEIKKLLVISKFSFEVDNHSALT
jgi:hypothetical protein